jgi:hypothetical protein
MVAMRSNKDLTWDGSRKRFQTFENRLVAYLMDKGLLKAIQEESIKDVDDRIVAAKQEQSNKAYQIILSAVSDLSKDDEDQSEAYRKVVKYGPKANPILDDYKDQNRAFQAFQALQNKYGDAVTTETVYSATEKALREFNNFEISDARDMEGELERLYKVIATLEKYKVKRTSLEILIKIQKCIENKPLYRDVVIKIREASVEDDLLDSALALNLLKKTTKLLIATYVSHEHSSEETVGQDKPATKAKIIESLKDKSHDELLVLAANYQMASISSKQYPICPICLQKGIKTKRGETPRHFESNCWIAHPELRPSPDSKDPVDNGNAEKPAYDASAIIKPKTTFQLPSDGIAPSNSRLGLQRRPVEKPTEL